MDSDYTFYVLGYNFPTYTNQYCVVMNHWYLNWRDTLKNFTFFLPVLRVSKAGYNSCFFGCLVIMLEYITTFLYWIFNDNTQIDDFYVVLIHWVYTN